MATGHLHVTVPDRVLKEIEKRRGDVNKSRFVSRILEEKFFQPEDPAQAKIHTE